jgi:hypothetical protein
VSIAQARLEKESLYAEVLFLREQLELARNDARTYAMRLTAAPSICIRLHACVHKEPSRCAQ